MGYPATLITRRGWASRALLAALGACAPAPPQGWATDLPELGGYASPRPADLTGDGALDIVIGAGKNECAAAKGGVLASDSRSGALLRK